MAEKKLYSREEFSELLQESAKKMAADKKLAHDALDVLIRADKHRWIHQTSWMGEPILNLPQDMFAMQEILFNARPEFVIETGVAWGGSLLFLATIMEIIDAGTVIGVDIFLPDDLVARIKSHKKLSRRIKLIHGSSIESKTVEKIHRIIKNSSKVSVILDSFHTHAHVIKELELYSPFVKKGQYIVCEDTIIEDIPSQKHRTRPWGPGNNPKTAMLEFLNLNDRFIVDENIGNKLLMTCNPSGYLKCVKN